MATEQPWVGIAAVAPHLGVCRDTIYRWIDTQGLPAHRVGRLFRIRLSQWTSRSRTEAKFVGKPDVEQVGQQRTGTILRVIEHPLATLGGNHVFLTGHFDVPGCPGAPKPPWRERVRRVRVSGSPARRRARGGGRLARRGGGDSWSGSGGREGGAAARGRRPAATPRRVGRPSSGHF